MPRLCRDCAVCFFCGYYFVYLTGHVPYVLIGAGTASFAAAKAIREKDPKAKVRMVVFMNKEVLCSLLCCDV